MVFSGVRFSYYTHLHLHLIVRFFYYMHLLRSVVVWWGAVLAFWSVVSVKLTPLLTLVEEKSFIALKSAFFICWPLFIHGPIKLYGLCLYCKVEKWESKLVLGWISCKPHKPWVSGLTKNQSLTVGKGEGLNWIMFCCLSYFPFF